MEPPDVHYARTPDGVHIAYQVIGASPTDLLVAPGVTSNIELAWEEPTWAAFIRRLAAFARVIVFDRRGMGLSDRTGHLPTLETQVDDLLTVADAVGATRPALFGVTDGASMAVTFAASFPGRTSALVLYGGLARLSRADDYPEGLSTESIERTRRYYEHKWASGEDIGAIAPSRLGDEAFRRWWGRLQRLSTSPGDAIALHKMIAELDVRSVLPVVTVPTLVLHRAQDRFMPVRFGRYLAAHIAGARYVELDGSDHVPWAGDTAALVDEIAEFITGAKSEPDIDRVLATVLFTDIVDSTRLMAELGDRRWRDVLDAHDDFARSAIAQHRGRYVNTTGDGVLATFDGPGRAVHCARAIRDSVRGLGLEIRAGLHTGEIELRGTDVAGLAVVIAQRVCAVSQAQQVLVSSTVKDLMAGSHIVFEERGTHALKGVPDDWRLYAVSDDKR